MPRITRRYCRLRLGRANARPKLGVRPSKTIGKRSYIHTGNFMIFFIALILGLIPAIIAALKGRRFFVWWVYGTLVLIIALPHSLFASILKSCPQCKESARRDANICPHCRTEFFHNKSIANTHGQTRVSRHSSNSWPE